MFLVPTTYFVVGQLMRILNSIKKKIKYNELGQKYLSEITNVDDESIWGGFHKNPFL